eukprot:3633123-Pyramimonas_sp.AAC.2
MGHSYAVLCHSTVPRLAPLRALQSPSSHPEERSHAHWLPVLLLAVKNAFARAYWAQHCSRPRTLPTTEPGNGIPPPPSKNLSWKRFLSQLLFDLYDPWASWRSRSPSGPRGHLLRTYTPSQKTTSR